MSTDKEHHNLVPVYECGTDIQADIIISYLKENGIEAFENSNFPHSTFPVSSDAQILVNEEDAEQARKLLDNADKFAPGTPEEPEKK
jgi:hypothetical protein